MNPLEQLDVERRHRSLATAQWRPMSIDGKVLEGVQWAALASTASWLGYWMKMTPGSSSVPHRHTALELLLVLEGQVADSDGRCFEAGDSLVYAAGSEHWLHSPEGCVLLVVESAPAVLG
ncbi:cupin domain-containing protein [Pseudomonas sp. X10]